MRNVHLRMRWIVLLMVVFFFACSSNNGTVRIKGSDTEVNLAVILAENFRKDNADVLVSVSGGGSGLGLASLLNGNADIANSSRRIKPSELSLFKTKHFEIDSFIFALDAIAFVISDKVTIDSISTENISKLLNGDIQNWEVLTNSKMPITIYGRQSNSGTYDYVKDILHIHFSPYANR